MLMPKLEHFTVNAYTGANNRIWVLKIFLMYTLLKICLETVVLLYGFFFQSQNIASKFAKTPPQTLM